MKRGSLICITALLLTSTVWAGESYPLLDYSKVDARQYCVFEGRLYTRGIRIKTDTGMYTCRFAEAKSGQSGGPNETLSWVRESL